MATMTATLTKDIKSRLNPALETLEENVRQARRGMVHGRHAAEDTVAGAARAVRRHPFGSIAAAAGTGVLAGCMMGFAFGWWARRTSA
jgi:ElaB/YqjD/DUF883 family membrane-anchored ribosome-binding protein